MREKRQTIVLDYRIGSIYHDMITILRSWLSNAADKRFEKHVQHNEIHIIHTTMGEHDFIIILVLTLGPRKDRLNIFIMQTDPISVIIISITKRCKNMHT